MYVGVDIPKLHMKYTKSVQVLIIIIIKKLTISILQGLDPAMDLEELAQASGEAAVEE